MADKKTILVLGATGQQGGAVAQHLLSTGWAVRGLTRDASSLKATALAKTGVTLVEGDMSDPHALGRAMQGAFGVFSVQPPTWLPTLELDKAESAVARSVVDAAVRAGVVHFVYSSVLAAEEQLAFRPDGKGSVERYLWQTGLSATVVRPAGFMENYLSQRDDLMAGLLNDPTAPGVAENLIAVEDIGGFVALIFQRAEEFAGKTIDLAGDRLTPGEIAATLSAALGLPIRHNQTNLDELHRISPLLAELVSWLNRHGYPRLDIAALRQLRPGMLTLDQWLQKRWKADLAGR